MKILFLLEFSSILHEVHVSVKINLDVLLRNECIIAMTTVISSHGVSISVIWILVEITEGGSRDLYLFR